MPPSPPPRVTLPSLGDPSQVVRWNGATWHVHTLVRDSMKDARAAQALQRLASDLVIAEVAEAGRMVSSAPPALMAQES